MSIKTGHVFVTQSENRPLFNNCKHQQMQ